MSVLQRKDLEQSPLADLHAIASELGIEGYRALRKDDLVTAILGGEGDAPAPEADEPEAEPEAREEDAGPRRPARRRRSRTTGRGDDRKDEQEDRQEDEEEEEPSGEPVAGVLDVLPNGSGFLRVEDGADVYVSPAQIRRCELRAGDEVWGPLRPPRRNERHPSLVHVENVNGGDAEPPEERPLFDELTAVHPSERLPSPDSLSAAPFGKGSRVAIAGPPGAGASRLLLEIVAGLGGAGGPSVSVVLCGARPEEVTEWRKEAGSGGGADATEAEQPLLPMRRARSTQERGPSGSFSVTGGSFDGSTEAQAQAAELAVERAKRTAERGGDAVVVIDSLEFLPAGVARRVFGAARKLEEGGSVTVIAATGSVPEPQRQASTRIALDAPAADGRPQISGSGSGTLRADLLR